MSEDDRAAKKARAQAMLKKRQQKKAATPSAVGIASPPPDSPASSSRALSPVPAPEPGNTRARDVGDLFDNVPARSGDTDWITSLPRAATPPAPVPLQAPSPRHPPGPPMPLSSFSDQSHASLRGQPPGRPRSGSPPEVQQMHADLEDLRRTLSELVSEKAALKASLHHLQGIQSQLETKEALLQQECDRSQNLQSHAHQLETDLESQQQTISLLVSEKASLAATLERLGDSETRCRETEALLLEERQRCEKLDTRSQQLEAASSIMNEHLRESQASEKDLLDKCREQERELQLINADLINVRAQSEEHQRRFRDLEEQIQSDDRVERLETSLKNTQDRADELEFQLTKLKQSHAALKSERDDVESRLRLSHQSDAEWKSKCADAQEALSVAQGQLASAASNRETLSQETSSLKLQIESAQRTAKELEQQLAIAVSELTGSSRQLSHAQAELRAANRRAEKAEETQMNLQSEGTTLMRSLDEMRPKIVQLTGEKLDLGEKISALEHALRGRDALVTQMEISLEQVREEKVEVEKLNRELALVQEKERVSAQEDLAEQQKAYEELQADIDVLRESLQAAQTDRATFHRRKSQHMEEIDRLASSSSAQAAELSTAQQELEERRAATEEAHDVLERAQNEIESLRFELASKDEELERLREAVSSAPSPTAGHRSLDGEIVSALRQQHALDLSAAQSNIRALETSVFEAQAHSHSLQKQVSALEDELAQIQNSPKPPPRPFSPRFLPSSPPASTQARSTHGLSKPNKLGAPPSRSVFDDVMTPETRHKRKVSLSMLKARIESEAAAASSLTRNPSSRALSPIPQQSSHPPPILATAPELVTGHPRPHQRPQFLDEVHVFWCHSCRGDLVIL